MGEQSRLIYNGARCQGHFLLSLFTVHYQPLFNPKQMRFTLALVSAIAFAASVMAQNTCAEGTGLCIQ